MKKNVTFLFVVSVILFSTIKINSQNKYPYQDSSIPVEERVTDLIKRMTVDEKIQQLDMYWGKEVVNMDKEGIESFSKEMLEQTIGKTGVGSIHDFYPVKAELANEIQKYAIENTRLGIPVMFIEEGLHGYLGTGGTVFPIPLGMSSMWDTALVHKIGRVIATEARAHGVDMILGPVLDLARDPRWGRVEETYGEDTYLDAMNGVAMVKGLQGSSLNSEDAVISEPKHFGVHSIPEGGSNTCPVNIGEREARSAFLYVFEKAVRDGGAMGIMAAYHEIDGIPCVDNQWLLTDVLRKEWGFKGFVLSDLGAIRMTLNSHYVAKDTSDALAQTFKAGMNMQFYDFDHAGFQKAMLHDLDTNTLSAEDLNRAVSDILRVKFLLGLFDHPYTDNSLVSKVYHTEEHQELALKAAQEGICLLKNDNGLLPVKKSVSSIAVVGPLAVSKYMGGYTDDRLNGISILDGLKQRAGSNLKISYEKGYIPDSISESADCIDKAIKLVKKSDLAVVVLGEEAKIIGEGKDRANLYLDGIQMNLIKALYYTGKPVVVVLFNGRPLTINWVAKNIPSIVEPWFGGEKGGLAIADVLLGNVNPSGKLPMTFPRSTGQLPYYYNHKPTSHHKYVDEERTPLFEFGRGLSYTNFEYSDLRVAPAKIQVDGTATISVKIKNTGKVDGTEVAQLYLRDEISSVTTPDIALKGFQRVTLKPGETKTVDFVITPEQLSLWNRQMKRVVEPGDFKIMVGSSSADIRQEGVLTVMGN
jgi:beta-glucosidase